MPQGVKVQVLSSASPNNFNKTLKKRFGSIPDRFFVDWSRTTDRAQSTALPFRLPKSTRFSGS
ncbi:MAG: hypothetical protein D6728_04930 [Cyanobacteria bacterium J055]|nr:MAG: hypothetical protein D6728_04930 [Cyanobacteria bacterium J055]